MDSVAAEILVMASRLSSQEKATEWFFNQPLVAFDFKTAQQLVAEGRADAVKAYLCMLANGIYG